MGRWPPYGPALEDRSGQIDTERPGRGEFLRRTEKDKARYRHRVHHRIAGANLAYRPERIEEDRRNGERRTLKIVLVRLALIKPKPTNPEKKR